MFMVNFYSEVTFSIIPTLVLPKASQMKQNQLNISAFSCGFCGKVLVAKDNFKTNCWITITPLPEVASKGIECILL